MAVGEQWTANEVAKAKYAEYKGYSKKTIAKAVGRTEASTNVKLSQLRSFEKTNMQAKTATDRIFLKALRLESEIRAGRLEDMRQKWVAELDRARGINTVFKKPEPPREMMDEVKPDTSAPAATEGLENFVSINISINGAQLERILGKIFGAVTS